MRGLRLGLAGIVLVFACQSASPPLVVAPPHETVVSEEVESFGGMEDPSDRGEPLIARALDPNLPELVSVAVISDLNSGYGSFEYTPDVHAGVAWLVNSLKPDLVISSGDMVAGQRQGLDYLGMWTSFHHAVSDPLRKANILLAVSPGNHDASAAEFFQQERKIFKAEWNARRPAVRMLEGSQYPLRYAFEKGGVLFVSLDITTTKAMNARQLAWLNRVLTENSKFKAKFVFGHVPLHLFAENRESEVLTTRDLEPLLELHAVSAFVTGHHHVFYPGLKRGVRYLSVPCLGTGPRRVDGSVDKSPRGIVVLNINPETGDFTYEAKQSPGFSQNIPTSDLPNSVGYGEKLMTRDHDPKNN